MQSFVARKKTILTQLREEFGDKSPKGSLDAPIVDLINYINGVADYVRLVVPARSNGNVVRPWRDADDHEPLYRAL